MAYISSTKGSLLYLKILVAFSLFLGVSHAATCSADDEVCDGNYTVEPKNECQLYLSHSSIPNGGLGVFTSVDYKKGDIIGEGEMLIPITDLPESDNWMVNDVQWGVDIDSRLFYEADASKMGIFIPGFGAQINCHFGLNNVGHKKPKFDSASLHRSKDPGVGAFTNWYDLPNVATRDIKSGEELFIDYGYGWFETRDFMGEIPQMDDFTCSDRIMRRIIDIADKHRTKQNVQHYFDDESSSVLEDVWIMVRNVSSQALERALPQRYEDLNEANKHGAALHSVGGPSSFRSKEWLNQNGMCIDNIYVNISSIPQAGRGAFSKRFLPKDSVVSPAPVLQLDRSFPEPHGLGLLLNYVFGHPDSSIMLLPYSSTVNFINHDSRNPNVKLRWSESSLHRKEFLDMSPKDVLKQGFGLIMEFVSLRDIQPNEEILFDYGAEFESGWQKHVEDWTPLPGSENYTSADEALKVMGILTVDEQQLNPYPDNIDTACYFRKNENTFYENITKDTANGNPKFKVEWNYSNAGCLRLCRILHKHDSSALYYDAMILSQESNLDEECILPKEEIVYVNKIPGYAVTLVDREMSKDQYLSNAFRQYIRISDDLYPKSWRENQTSETSEKKKMVSDQCELYLAQSSIPNAGIGIYTSVAYKTGDLVGESEMLIPTVNFPYKESSWLVEDVEWGLNLDTKLYYEGDESTTLIYYPGFGAQINCHFGLNNVEHKNPKYDSAGLHRSKDPGVGAFTYWYDMPNNAVRDIQAGEELFTDYGESWFTGRAYRMGEVPTEEDYACADRIVEKIQTISKKQNHRKNFKAANTSALEDLWDMLRNVSSQALERALPQRYDELNEVIKIGTARHSVGGPSSIRSQEWLDENGMCMDQIYVNISTIPQAGRGAFAKRFLPNNTVVAPAPVLQINRRFLFHGTTGFQLLFNYAFGHPDSSIFLLPYGSAVNFINHDSRSPNVKLQWSTSPLHRKDFLDMSSEKVLREGFGLIMEFVSLRDILANEEIVFDYGVKWERAWQNHVEEWTPIPGSETYKTAHEVLEAMGILTVEEQKTNTYPGNVRTACYFSHTEDTRYVNVTRDGDLLPTFEADWRPVNGHCLRWCSILSRYSNKAYKEPFYDVLLEPQDTHLPEDCEFGNDEITYVLNVPSKKISLVDVKLSRDQHLPSAFRHYIQISDELYPRSWRQNRAQQ